MSIDKQEFFIQMTTRICSSLDIEIALQRVFQYLKQFMPVEYIFLHLYDRSITSCRTIAEVTEAKSRLLEVITPLSPEGQASFEIPGLVENTRIVRHANEDPIVAKVYEMLGIPHMSGLVLRLVIEGKRLGSLSIATSQEPCCFTEEHLHLMSMLNEPISMAFSNALRYHEVLQLKERLTDDNRYLNEELLRLSSDEIIGSDAGLKQVMAMVRKIATLDNPVMLLGETGVGKGVIASAIHQLSPRRNGPFIAVNSGAIPDTLMDNELFGHERGAFTGAKDLKRGRFEYANHGTIFLDEIGEMPPQVQIRMLRVVQEKVIERVGGTKPIPVDIRIIAATHRNLEEMVKNNQFRQDLWFRLNVFPIRVIPLRERKEDIPSLVYYFVRKKSWELKLPIIPQLARGAIDRLMHYQWPGNVRELENVIEREMILNPQGPLTFNQLAFENRRAEILADMKQGETSLPKIDEVLRDHILRTLKTTNGVIHGPRGAAAILGINPSTLRSQMGKLGIPYGRQSKQKAQLNHAEY